MINRTNSANKDNEHTDGSVSKPNSEPDMPPRQTIGNSGCCDLPSVDVEGIRNPEGYEIPECPFASFRLDWLEIVVLQEELR